MDTHMLVHPLPIWQAFPWLPCWSKEEESGARRSVRVLLIICGGCEQPFIQTMIVPSGPLLWDRGFTLESREEVLPFQFATKYVACINLSTRSFFLLFLTPLWFPRSPPNFPCGLFSPLVADVWNGQYCRLHLEVAYLFIYNEAHLKSLIEIILIASI